jgi:hypothetical protein
MIRTLYLVVVAGLGLGSPVISSAEEPLGRLFFTPEQRAALDAGKKIVAPKSTAQAPTPTHRPLTLGGVVVRSDGERTVWANGKAYHNDSPDGVEVRTNRGAPGNAEVRVQGQSLAARVKVGQQLDLNSGKVHDSAPRDTRAEEDASGSTRPAATPSFRQKKKKAAERDVQEAGERDRIDSGASR